MSKTTEERSWGRGGAAGIPPADKAFMSHTRSAGSGWRHSDESSAWSACHPP